MKEFKSSSSYRRLSMNSYYFGDDAGLVNLILGDLTTVNFCSVYPPLIANGFLGVDSYVRALELKNRISFRSILYIFAPIF